MELHTFDKTMAPIVAVPMRRGSANHYVRSVRWESTSCPSSRCPQTNLATLPWECKCWIKSWLRRCGLEMQTRASQASGECRRCSNFPVSLPSEHACDTAVGMQILDVIGGHTAVPCGFQGETAANPSATPQSG